MAVVDKKQTIPVMTGGMNTADLTNGVGWIQNLNHYQNAWETRLGFGVMGVFDTQMLVKGTAPEEIPTPFGPTPLTGKGPVDLGFLEICGTYSFITDFGHQQEIIIVKGQGNTSQVAMIYPEWAIQQETTLGLETIFYTAIIHDKTTNTFLEEPLFRKTTETQTLREIADYPFNPDPATLIGASVNVGNQHGALESSYYPFKNYQVIKETIVNPLQTDDIQQPFTKLPSCFFVQYYDKVYFGNADLGIHYYNPTIFTTERNKRVENYQYKTILTGYSETSVVKKLVWGDSTDNVFIDQGWVFFRNSEVPVIVDMCVWNDRMVFLTADNRILYSQPEQPYAIIGEDFDTITSEYPLTAISEVNGRLMIFSPSETYILQPVDGNVLASGGRQIKVSSTIGCFNSAGRIKVEGSLFWISDNGIFTSTGSGDINELTDPGLDKFFKDYIQNAMTNYYANNGWTTLQTDEQPRLDYTFNPIGLNVVYHTPYKHIIFNFTQLRLSLIFNIDTKEFYLWNYESVVSTYYDEEAEEYKSYVGSNTKLKYFWLSSANNDPLYGTFLDRQEAVDATTTFEDLDTYPEGNPTEGYYVSYPIVFTEYGRGGALDRTQDLLEEYRKISSGYVKLTEETPSMTSDACVYFEKGFWQEPPFDTPSGEAYDQGDNSVSDAVYWLPVSIQLEDFALGGQVEPPNVIYMNFRFDKDHWKPVFNNTAQRDTGIWQLDYDVPTERLAVYSGFGGNAPVAGIAEVACYNATTGLTSQNGEEIRICIDPANGMTPGSYSWFPRLNVIQYWKNPFILLPFKRRLTGVNNVPINNSFSLGITLCVDPPPVRGGARGFQIIRNDEAGGSREDDYVMTPRVLYWMETYTYPKLQGIYGADFYSGGGNRQLAFENTGKFQSVDWLYKSAEIGDGIVGLKPRGSIAQMTSHGKATSNAFQGWDLGQYNILVSTNYKQYQGQILDYDKTLPTSNPLITKDNTQANNITKDKDINITSIYGQTTEEAIKKTFGLNVGGDNITLGDTANQDTGNYLVDSSIFVNKVTSDGTRGERFSYTFFGHMKNKAERIYIKSINAIYRVIGQVRRTGR